MLQLNNITDSPCNEISITVSGYNGLDGEIYLTNIVLSSGQYNQWLLYLTLYHYFSYIIIVVPSSDVTIPVSIIPGGELQLTVMINVSFVNIHCSQL